MLAKKIENYFDRLWPIHRSLSGPGYNKSLEILSEIVPFNQIEFASGQKVFDRTIPKEWHVHDAYVIDPNGQKRFDINKIDPLELTMKSGKKVVLQPSGDYEGKTMANVSIINIRFFPTFRS